MPVFSQKGYRVVAAMLRAALTRDPSPAAHKTLTSLATEFAAFFASDSPRFNRQGFLETAGVIPPGREPAKPRRASAQRETGEILSGPETMEAVREGPAGAFPLSPGSAQAVRHLNGLQDERRTRGPE